MDYTYREGDKVYLKYWADSKYNPKENRGREVTIIDIDRHDPFIPYNIENLSGYRHWLHGSAIAGYYKPLGLKI